MRLDHERLHVYRVSLDLFAFAHELTASLPRGHAHLVDQLSRATTSVALNIAEGAGKRDPRDKRRYYLTARGSATESAAVLDLLRRVKLIDEERHRVGRGLVVDLVAMLVRLTQAVER